MTMNAAQRAVRVSKLEPKHTIVNNALTTMYGQTLSQIAMLCGITPDDAERRLSLLVDEGLCTRSRGPRATALYTAV